jgi:WD40 repeat protein
VLRDAFSLHLNGYINAVIGGQVRTFEHKGEVMCVALKEDGSVLITGQGKLVFVWDVVTGSQTSLKKGHADIVRCMAFKDERVRMWR